MLGWFRPKLPLPVEDQAWIDDRMQWLLREFGWERLRRVPVVCPTEEFFPDTYDGTHQAVRALLPRVCKYMGVDSQRIELNFYSERRPSIEMLELIDSQPGTAGLYYEQDGKCQVWLEQSHLHNPVSTVATLAHELGHVHLLGDRRLTEEEADHEPLTDLLTVCLGMGIFTANSVISETFLPGSDLGGYLVRRKGYLTGIMFGYALAKFAVHRGETKPAWARHLRLDVHTAFWKSLRYLRDHDRGYERPIARPAVPPGAFKAANDQIEEEVAETPVTTDGQTESTGIDFDTADGWLTAGVMQVNMGEYEAAIESFDEAIALEPNDAEAYQFRGDAYAQLEEFASALADATSALELDPDDIGAYRVRGIAWAGLEQHEQAIADFLRVLSEEPEDANVHYYHGRSLAALKEYESALRAFNLAIRHQPTMAEYYRARGDVRELLGQPSKAAADHREAEGREQASQ